LNGVWKFRGFEPKGCGELPECHNKRIYFQLDLSESFYGYDRYLMGTIPNEFCEDPTPMTKYVILGEDKLYD